MKQHTTRRIPLTLAFALLLFPAVSPAQDVMTPERLWEIKRISSPAVSPDGQSFVYGVRTYDIGTNKGNTDLWLRPVAGGAPRRLTDLDGSESGAAWRPDGQWIGFLASTDDGRQWHEVRPDGGDIRQVTTVPGGPDGGAGGSVIITPVGGGPHDATSV